MAQDPRADRKSIFNKWDDSSYLESSFFIFQRNPCQNNLRQIWRLFPRFVAFFVVCCDRFQAPFPDLSQTCAFVHTWPRSDGPAPCPGNQDLQAALRPQPEDGSWDPPVRSRGWGHHPGDYPGIVEQLRIERLRKDKNVIDKMLMNGESQWCGSFLLLTMVFLLSVKW